MRNLKRILSLALACVMVIGMMVMTTGAADFTDADEITYTEAVDVMSTLEVLGGYNGVFDPNGTLTRDQGAAIIARMMLGAETAGKLVGTGMFKDTTGWSAGVVEYCANLGIVSGYNGEFFPGQPLSALAFGKMLLVALGYDAAIEGYIGDNWATNIALDMIEAGLDIKGVDLNGNLTREQAAQMAFTALQTPTVYYNGGKGTNITLADGTKVVMGAGNLTKTAGSADIYNYDGSADTYQELVEKLYPTLTLTATDNTTFERPAYEWQYTKAGKTTKILVEDEPVAVYTTAVKASQIYADLGLTAASVTPDNVYVNGADTQITSTSGVVALTKNGMATYGGNGIVTEVYKTGANAALITQTKYTLGYVSNVVSYPATAVKGAYTSYTIDNVSLSSNVYDDGAYSFTGVVFSSVVNRAADLDTVVLNGDFAKGDYVLYVTDTTTGVGTNYVYPVSTVSGKLTASTATTYTIGGTEYNIADVTVAGGTAAFATALYSNTKSITAVADSYGNIIAPVVSPADAINYVYVVTAEDAHSLFGTTLVASVTATVVDANGTAQDISVTKIGANSIDGSTYKATSIPAGLYTYKLSKEGTYELTAVAQNVDGSFNYKTGDLLNTGIYGNDNTVFYTIKTKNVGGKTKVESVSTTVGMANMGDVTSAVGSYVKTPQNVATYVFLTTATAAAADQVVYYNGAYTFDGTDYTYSVNCDAEATTLVNTTGMTAKGLYTINGSTNVATAKNMASGYSAHTGVYVANGKTYGLTYNAGLLSVVETTVNTGVATTTANIDTIAGNVAVYTYSAATGECTASTAAEMDVFGASLIYIAANGAGNAIGAIYVVK